MSLRKKGISGFSWTFAQQFSVQILSFGVSIILARLVLPQEFGLIALISVFMGIGNCLVDGGLTTSLIKTENPTQVDLSTIFYLNIIGSVIIYLVLFIVAPYIADFYNQQALILVVRVYCLSIIINAFNAVQATLLTKEMNFKSQMAIQIPSTIAGAIVGIILAYKHLGVWSLVWMSIIQSAVNCLLHWISNNWRPRLIFNTERFRHHFKFGYKLTLSNLLDTVFENLYSIIIGKFYSPAQLALYNRANSLQMLPVQNISTALNKVSFPLFSQIQNDDVKLRNAYRLIMTQVVFWIVPIMLIMNLCAEPIIRLLLTESWLPSVPFLKILTFYGILYPLHIYNLNILLVKGRSDLFLKLEIAKKILFIAGIFLAFQFGILALAWWQVLFSIGAFYINTYYSGSFINYPFFKQLRDITPSLTIGFFIFFIMQYVLGKLLINIPIARIAVLSIVFMSSYFALSVIFKNQAIKDGLSIIKKRSFI